MESNLYCDDNLGTECDNYANSLIIGICAAIIRTAGRRVLVKGFTNELHKVIIVPVVDAAVVYEFELTGDSILVIIRNALHIIGMTVNLMAPFMMRLTDLIVNKYSRFFSPNPTIKNHSIYCTKT